MDKKKQLAFNLNNFLLSTSIVLDLAEENISNTTKNHSKRVAFISLKIGQILNLTPPELADLCAFSLIRNIAISKELNDKKEELVLAQECADKLPFLCGFKNVIKYHQEYFNGSGLFGIKDNKIPLLAQIISFSHLLDKEFDLSSNNITNKKDVVTFLKDKEGVLFSPEIIDAFLDVSLNIDFWLDIQNENDVLFYIFSTLHDFTINANFEKILVFTSIFSIIDINNSEFIQKCSKMTDFYNFEHKDKQTFLIAASLHNIGKLAIPKEIINKKSKLSEDEYEVIKSYPYYTKKVLSNLMGFNDITKWACRVQERMDGKGYPFSLEGKDLSLKDRLMSVLNIYQSLRESKPFRSSYSHEDSISIMLELATNKKIDEAIVKDIKDQFFE